MLSVYRPVIALTSYKAQLLQVTHHINLKGYADEKFMEEIVIFKQLVLFQRSRETGSESQRATPIETSISKLKIRENPCIGISSICMSEPICR